MCAGQGRDVIDVVATHPRGPEVSALLVELDPALVAFARDRARAAGVADRIRIVEGDASLSRWYADDVPADLVLVCGVFGNISAADITRTIQALRGFCRPGRPRDVDPAPTPARRHAGHPGRLRRRRLHGDGLRGPEGSVLAVGHHRFDGATAPFDPDQRLFDFVGDGSCPHERRRPGPSPRRRDAPMATDAGGPDRRRPASAPRPPPDRHRLHPLELVVHGVADRPDGAGAGHRAGLVIFGLDAIQGTFYTEIAVDHLGLESLAGVSSSAPRPSG